MNNSTKLRDYQLSMLQDLYRAWKRNRSVLVQMPTGTGKTVLLAEIIRNLTPAPSPKGEGSDYQGGGILIVAHRRELIAQISQTLDGFGVEHGLIVSGKEVDETKRVQVASIQTLVRRKPAAAALDFSLIIIDEAHHALAETYRTLWDRWPGAKFLGLTATPCRLSGEPFTDLFDMLLQSWSIKKFVKKGFLTDMEYVSVRSNSVILRKVASLSKRGSDGDYQTREMANVLDTTESIAHLYDSYKKYTAGKKGIVYAINRDHAQHIMEYYKAQGVSCAVIDAKTPAEERRELVALFREGRQSVLVNVDIFSEGFDVPAVEFIQLARPTLSLSKYLQQLGRGMRPCAGKERVTILDQVGLYLIFGLPTIDRAWQRMFRGELKGKGLPLSVRGVQAWGMGEDKLLVNEEMFRVDDYIERDGHLIEIKRNRKPSGQRPTERHGKLELFKEQGLIGIKVGGKVTCPAMFESVEAMGKNKKYFGFGILPRGMAGNEETRTVISKDGEDLHARLTGKFSEERDDVFEFRKSEQGRFVILHWDARYDRYYRGMQRVRLGGVEFFVDGHGEYTLRSAHAFHGKFRAQDVLFNDNFMMIDHDLFVKHEEVEHYHIAGFLNDSVIVETGKD
ncbi:MAG: DEAD/DEAH box helicase [Prevotella sp.]|nr:DEAD/DEAH box helicase [Prevotella sp.]